jgi:small subunit ribosomal protein S2
MQEQISLMQLFEVGAHRGNSRSKTNPKLRPRVHGFANGISVIDLVKTIESLYKAEEFMYSLGKKRKQILVVGTSKHIREKTSEVASQFKPKAMPFVDNRWLGGTLTNWSTIRKTLKTLQKLESIEQDEKFFKGLARNERLRISRQKEKIERSFGGLRTLKNDKPAALFMLDIDHNPIAVKEANIKNIPVVGLANTKAEVLPKTLENVVVSNVNSINTVDFLVERMVKAYNEGFESTLEQSDN